MTIIVTTGITKTSVLIIHHQAFESPRILTFAPLIAVTKAASPLTKATSNASSN
jgi:hypothetical protein